MPRYPNVIPLGKFTIASAGTTQLLSANCGALAGGIPAAGSQIPAPTGIALRQIRLMADKANTGQVFLLPAGKTVSANPSLIIAVITPGAPVSLPEGIMLSSGMVPENYCLDTDTASQVVYGYGVTG